MPKISEITWRHASSTNIPPYGFMTEYQVDGYVNFSCKTLVNTQESIRKRISSLIVDSADAYIGNKEAQDLKQKIINLDNRMRYDIDNRLKGEGLPSDIKKVCYAHMENEKDEILKKVYEEYSRRLKNVKVALGKYNSLARNKNKRLASEVTAGAPGSQEQVDAETHASKTYKVFKLIEQNEVKWKGKIFMRVKENCTNDGRTVCYNAGFYERFCKYYTDLIDFLDNEVFNLSSYFVEY